MLQVIDNWLPTTLVQSLQQLCDAHGALRQNQLENQLFSWRPDHGAPRSAHAPEQQDVMERTISANFCALSSPRGAPNATGVEWWCNTNNDLDWHIDKDEAEYRRSGQYALPLLSTVFYPHVSCAGGELLVADNPPVKEGQTAPPPRFRSVISIPPVANRLVVFSPGIVHRINPFEGERYSIAVNIWQSEPLTTQESAPPA